MSTLPIRRIVLYKHGVGYFERESTVTGDATLSLTFRQDEVSDILKSLTVLDMNGGHISSVSYDSTKPLEQLLADVALSIPDHGSLVSLLPQLKGAKVALHTGVADPVQGSILGIDTTERHVGDGIVKVVLLSILTSNGSVHSFDLHSLANLQILDANLKRDLDYYLKTNLSSKKKEARTFTFFAQGKGQRTIRLSYAVASPVWKATYRILLADDNQPAIIQGWAVVDNTQDDDWEEVQLSLVSGLPVSFVHDLYTPRHIERPKVQVKNKTGVLPPEIEQGFGQDKMRELQTAPVEESLRMMAGDMPLRTVAGNVLGDQDEDAMMEVPDDYGADFQQSVSTQVREQAIGDFLEYQIKHPVTIHRNQSALVPIIMREFDGESVLLYNKRNRPQNPLSAVLLKNTTGLTLENGPVTVLDQGRYVGESMLETVKPNDEHLVAYAVELSVVVNDNINSYQDKVTRVVIRHGSLTAYHGGIHTTNYTIKNKSDKEHRLYLEHPRVPKGRQRADNNWKLTDCTEPVDTTENYWRFLIKLPPKQETTFTVKQEIVLDKKYQLYNLSVRILQMWIEAQYFDQATVSKLRDIAECVNETTRINDQKTQLENERISIGGAQKRIRENLNSLGDRSSEKELRERYVRTLQTQEDRLEEIDNELTELKQAREKLDDTLHQELGKLEYDAAVVN